jgi:MoaA/NifB/PqqE/SkfB family radical SAM enzyme
LTDTAAWPAAAFAPVGPRALVLLRLGEACNLRCPMCTNSGLPERWRLPTAELWRRLDRLRGLGFRALALTGGEPTLHPAWGALVEKLGAEGWRWFLHTNATRVDPARAAQWRASGLERALVSMHGPPAAHAVLSGADTAAETTAGARALRAAGVEVVLNCVLARPNIDLLVDHVDWMVEELPGVALKLVGAARVGRGADWAPALLPLSALRAPLRAALDRAEARGLRVQLEGIPRCAHGRWEAPDAGRAGWEETHYLSDEDGHRVLSMTWLDARARWHPPLCRGCSARRGCPGLPLGTLEDPGLLPRR